MLKRYHSNHSWASVNGITYWYHTALWWSHCEAKGLIECNARTMTGRGWKSLLGLNVLVMWDSLPPQFPLWEEEEEEEAKGRGGGSRLPWEYVTHEVMANYPRCSRGHLWCFCGEETDSRQTLSWEAMTGRWRRHTNTPQSTHETHACRSVTVLMLKYQSIATCQGQSRAKERS